MKERLIIWCLLLASLCLLAIPVIADDDDEDGGGIVLNAELQWKMAQAAWDRREYDDAAVMFTNFAEKNPDDKSALDARWRAYCVYRDNRPNADRKVKARDKALNDCDRWERKYATTDKERGATAYWYRAYIFEREQGREPAIAVMKTLLEKFPGTSLEDDADWTLAEWLREAKHYQDAIRYYAAYRKVIDGNETAGLSWFREGNCQEEMGNQAEAIECYKGVLNGNYNWGWGQVHWGALDAARRLKKMGEEALARAFLIKITDKCDPNWDVTKQALTELGQQPSMRVMIYPYFNQTFTTGNINIDGRTKLALLKEMPILVRPTYLPKDTPFNATLTITPKVEMAKTPENMKAGDGKAFTTEIAAKTGGDFWYGFTQTTQQVAPPDNLVITRKWEKVGETWGECTIRIQSSARWHMWIYLPNNKSNPNNFNVQPNEVQENGKTFRWYDWYDLKEGMTIKFPVEIGANVAKFYPKIRLEHGTQGWFYRDSHGAGKQATYECNEFTVTLASEQEYPFTFTFPGTSVVMVNEITE